jgi:DNA-binding MarR family transcriptional regulator
LDSRHAADALSNFGFLLKDVSRLLSRDFERRCAAIGLTLQQCRVLGDLQRNEGISQARLAELTDSDPMTLGRLLARMESSALVERRPDPSDGRAHSLYLCPKAGPLLDEIWRLSERTRAVALTGLDSADRGQLVALLERIRDNLDGPMPEAAGSESGAARPATSDIVVSHRTQRKAA